MKGQGKFITGLLMGVGLAYLLDPDRGARRRALARDKATHAGRRLAEELDASTRDLRNRVRGTAAELRAKVRPEPVDDDVLHDRVRSSIGRVVSHPRAIEVAVSGGRVTLRGQVPEAELKELLHAAERVRGASQVVNELEVQREGDVMASLQAGQPKGTPPR
jgi:osmotically-inducible protein OsmY